MLQRLRIGLIQMNCEKGAIAQNLERISGYLVEAQQQGIAVVGFPEMSITGYADPTRYPQAVLRLDSPEMCRFLDLTRGLPATVLAGLIEANPGNHDGQTREIGAVTKPFITQVVARNGKLAGWYRKKTIQDEEELWFSPGETSPIFQHNGLSFGIAICADITTESVFAECARQGARIVFELAAPGLYGERATRNWRSGFEWWQGECRKYLSRFAEKYHLWIAVATQAGRTVDEDFPGGGYVFAPDGRCLFATPDWSPGAVYLELDLKRCRVTQLSFSRP